MSIFHRYNSTIHGNYRKGYLQAGIVTGMLLATYIIVRLLMGNPVHSPVSYVSDAIILVCVILFTAMYRNALPDKKITLKEAMLFGIGTAILGALIYGLALWGIGLASSTQTVMFTNNMWDGSNITAEDPQLHYWAAWWGIVAFFYLAVLGGFGAFLASIMLRNEKGEVVGKKTKKEKKNI